MFGANGDIAGVRETVRYCENLFSELKELPQNLYTGIGGTITSVSAMLQKMEVYRPEKIQGSRIALTEIDALLKDLAKMTVEERKTLPGLQPQRADIIPYGIAILSTGMHVMDLAEITVSDADNLEGYTIQYQNFTKIT